MKRQLAITLFLATSLLGLAGVYALPWHGLTVYERWREERSGHVFTSANTRRRIVALTFDDGPDPRYTPEVLDILKREGVHATFFVVGRMLEAHPDLARQIVADGNVLGNHTETHPHLEFERRADVRRELNMCEDRIEALTGERTHLFRPPRGFWDPAAFAEARRDRYNIILWSLAFDREAIHSSAALRRRVVRLARPGDVILLHDGAQSKKDIRAATVHELDDLIRGLKRRGFTFATVPELLHVQGDEALGPRHIASMQGEPARKVLEGSRLPGSVHS